MTESKIGICNQSLAMLGAEAIRSFDEDNKRSRMADVFFDFTRDFLLDKFDWNFARKLIKLQSVVVTTPIPERMYAYQVPNDCKTARDLYPPGNRDKWEIMGDVLYCERTLEENVYLFYTSQEVDVSKYPSSFSNLLALGIAVRMCPPVTQDKALTRELQGQYRIAEQEIWEGDANIGNTYKDYDDDPENDTFVNVEGILRGKVGDLQT